MPRLPRLTRLSLLALAACAALGLAACDEVERIDNISIPVSGEVVVERGTLVEMLLGDFPTFDAFTRLDLADTATFRNEDYDVDDVDSVVLDSLVMRVKSPDGADLAFLGEVIFYVETADLERREIARADSFPAGVREVAFETTGDDLKRYLLAREGTITTEVNDSRRPNVDTTIEVVAVFDVDINVL